VICKDLILSKLVWAVGSNSELQRRPKALEQFSYLLLFVVLLTVMVASPLSIAAEKYCFRVSATNTNTVPD
jgi:hypothetical protein